MSKDLTAKNEILKILEELDDVIDSGGHLPWMKGRSLINADQLREVVDKIRMQMPKELNHANEVLNNKAEIIASAKREAEAITREAEEKARRLVAQHEITREAQQTAREILTKAQEKSREMRKSAQQFADSVLERSDTALATSLQEIRRTRSSVRSSPATKNTV